MPGIQNLQQWLEGVWQVERTIQDALTDEISHFKGQMTFKSLGENELHASEIGSLSVNSKQYDATKALIYRFADPSCASIYFEDGQPFHVLDLTQGSYRVSHLCKEDHYQGHYQAREGNTLFIQWDILGPRKDQILTTCLRRVK